MYTAIERLMVWCGLSWRHIIIFGFLYTAILSMYAISDAIDDTHNTMFGKVFRFKNENIDEEKLWIDNVLPSLLIPIIVGSGFVMMKYGRFIVIMGALIVMALLAPLLMFPSNYKMFSAGIVLNGIIFRSIVIGGVMIYAYETVPIKYRRVALLSLSIFASLGKLSFGLARWISGNGGYGSTEDRDTVQSQLSVLLGIACGATLLIPILWGAFVRTDSPVSLVVRGFERTVYRYLVSWKIGTDNQPPMNEDDFVYQVEIERERSYMDFKTMCFRKWPALLFLFLTGYSWQIADFVFMTPYKYIVFDYIEGAYDENPIKGLIVMNCCCLAGTLFAIIYTLKYRSITILPALAMGFIFVGAAICSPVEAFYTASDNDHGLGNPIEFQFLPMRQVLAGQVIMWVGYTLAQFVWGLLIVEIVPGTYRPVVVMAQMGFLELTNMAIRAIYTRYKWDGRGLYITASVVLGLIALSYMVVFVGTNWFSRADPAEEDDGEIAIDVLDEEEVYLDNGKTTVTLDSYMYSNNSNTGLSSTRIAN